jgi:DNA-binding HxlR family transcriptional regulator
MGKKKYGDFLEANPKLSGKVLSERLRDLEQEGIIRKKIVSKTPLKAVYELTEKGKDLGRVLYELVMFSVRNYSKKVFKKPFSYDEKTCSLLVKQTSVLYNCIVPIHLLTGCYFSFLWQIYLMKYLNRLF